MAASRQALAGWRRWLLLGGFLGATALAGGGYSLYRTSSSHTFVGTEVDGAPRAEGVRLLSAGGVPLTLPGAWRSKLVLVFFGYTNCPDVCPLTMAQLAKVYRDLGEPEEVQVVMVTVDPKRDTPERTAQYAQGFHPDFAGLSGTTDAIARAERAFFVDHNHVGAEVAHNSHVTLLDRDGRLRLVYTQGKVPALAKDLQTLLKRRPW